ncbi:MAG: hypothetical protein ACIWVG_04645, partial [Gloeotrichia echinulata HAB0833]
MKQTKPYGKSKEQAERERRAASNGRRATDNPTTVQPAGNTAPERVSTYTGIERRVANRRKPPPAPELKIPAYVYAMAVLLFLWLVFSNMPETQIVVHQTFSPDADMKCVKGKMQYDSWIDRFTG